MRHEEVDCCALVALTAVSFAVTLVFAVTWRLAARVVA